MSIGLVAIALIAFFLSEAVAVLIELLTQGCPPNIDAGACSMLKAAVYWVGSVLTAAELNDPCHAGSWLFALSGKHIQYDSKNQA